MSEATQQTESDFVLRGRPENPKPFSESDTVYALRGCPSCNGRGWFLINPFATGGGNGCGGLGNTCQCLTCADAHAYYKKHGKLPSQLAHLLENAS